jgi:hypothetical protein
MYSPFESSWPVIRWPLPLPDMTLPLRCCHTNCSSSTESSREKKNSRDLNFPVADSTFNPAGGDESTKAFPSPRSRASDGAAEPGHFGASRRTGWPLGTHLPVHDPGIPGPRPERLCWQEDEFCDRYDSQQSWTNEQRWCVVIPARNRDTHFHESLKLVCTRLVQLRGKFFFFIFPTPCVIINI